MKRCYIFHISLLLLALFVFLAAPRSVHAHGHVEVGDYELVIGFQNEPAYQGEPNGLSLEVTNHTTGQPVSGLEETLQVEIIYGASVKAVELRPRFGAEGAYTAYVLPTEAGDYTWRIFGEIEGTPVDVSMTSGPETFSPVEPKSTFSFPGAEPANHELLAELESAHQTARTALFLGGGGLLVGLVGLVMAANAMRLRRG